MGETNNPDIGDSDISPTNDSAGVQQGTSYGYPGVRGTGAAAAKMEPTVRTNGKMADHK